MYVDEFLCIYECICIILYESLHVPVTTPLLPTKYQTKLFLTHDILIFRTFAEKSMTNVGFSFVYHSIFFSRFFSLDIHYLGVFAINDRVVNVHRYIFENVHVFLFYKNKGICIAII